LVESLGVGTAVATVDTVLRALPVGWQLEEYTDDRSVVSWVNSVFGALGRPPNSTSVGRAGHHVKLRWAGDDWKQVDSATTDGPVPIADVAPPTAAPDSYVRAPANSSLATIRAVAQQIGDDMDLHNSYTPGTGRVPGGGDALGADGERQIGPRTDVPKQVDLLDAVRVAGVPVSLGASAWTGLPRWLVGVMVLYSVVGGPVQALLYTVLSAAADRLANRIRAGPGRGLHSPSSLHTPSIE
jgi:hypothetical protein